jgi:hypothetical protein
VTAHPVDDHDPDDPVEILAVLPEGYHAHFLAEYTAAVEGARRPEQFRQLQELLRLWRLRAVAYSGPGYEERVAAARHGRTAGIAPAEQVIPGWPGRGPGEVSYRVEFGGGAQVKFHSLPEHARDALVDCAAELAGQPWDAVIRPPGDDPRFREAVFGSGSSILGFYLDEDAQLIRVFDIVWIG